MQLAGQSLEYTQEHTRVGAIKGVITYADGTVLNLFTEYGLVQPTPISFPFSLTTADRALLQSGVKVRKSSARWSTNLDGLMFSASKPSAAMTSSTRSSCHPKCDRRTSTGPLLPICAPAMSAQARRGAASSSAASSDRRIIARQFPACRWSETNKAYFYPTGIPNLFATVFAPADYIETVNTMGLPRYVKQYQMLNDKGIHMDTQMNALNFCTRIAVPLQSVRVH